VFAGVIDRNVFAAEELKFFVAVMTTDWRGTV